MLKRSAMIAGLALLLSIGPIIWADSMDQLQAFAREMKTFSASFEQQVMDESGRLLESSGGTMAMQEPDRFRWHYLGDFEQLIVADGEHVWIHDVELEQVTVREQASTASRSPLYLLTDPERLELEYQIEERGQVNGMDLIGLLPRRPDGEIEWVELGFRDQLIESVVIKDALGQKTLIRFSRPQLNLPLDEAVFQFSPPPGTDVIGAQELDLDPGARAQPQ